MAIVAPFEVAKTTSLDLLTGHEPSKGTFAGTTFCVYNRLTATGAHRNIVMPRLSIRRSAWVRVVCILSMALVCAIGVVQAVHVHQDDSSASHHVCSICSTAHASLSAATVTTAPVLATAALAIAAPESDGIFRSAAVHFIRPPPAV